MRGEPVENACRRMETRTCPPSGPCAEVCARFESDDPTPWMEKSDMTWLVEDYLGDVVGSITINREGFLSGKIDPDSFWNSITRAGSRGVVRSVSIMPHAKPPLMEHKTEPVKDYTDSQMEVYRKAMGS